MSTRHARRRQLLGYHRAPIILTDTDYRRILQTIPVKFRKSKEKLLREEIEKTTVLFPIVSNALSSPSPSALVEAFLRIQLAAADLADKLSGDKARATKRELTLSLPIGSELRVDLGFGSVPNGLADALMPYVARDLQHENQYPAHIQMLGHRMGVADPSYRHLHSMLENLVLLSRWCAEAASDIRKRRSPRVARHQHRGATSIALLEALGEIWEKVTGVPAVHSAESTVSGEVRGHFADFARVVGQAFKVNMSNHLMRKRLTVWRSK